MAVSAHRTRSRAGAAAEGARPSGEDARDVAPVAVTDTIALPWVRTPTERDVWVTGPPRPVTETMPSGAGRAHPHKPQADYVTPKYGPMSRKPGRCHGNTGGVMETCAAISGTSALTCRNRA
ncbi:hypothetical protein Plo01_30550 [Planobispora longispora]|uniref:Uncharacterized protein n=1 Tax=Planobispora longispora TaxID=28887 RepID=A0A8J3RM35_9ACTN|nr:hypothetical protein Plo01_30550 [Planobispora longispora]